MYGSDPLAYHFTEELDVKSKDLAKEASSFLALPREARHRKRLTMIAAGETPPMTAAYEAGVPLCAISPPEEGTTYGYGFATVAKLPDTAHRITYSEEGMILTPTFPISETKLARHRTVYGDAGTEQWTGLREQCLKRDRHTCQRCTRKLRSSNLSAHHIVPRAEGGPTTLANLVTLCTPCHDWIEVQEDLPRNRPAIVGSWNGATLGKTDRLRLEARGLADQGLVLAAIADRLGISDRTAARYISA